MPGGAAFVILGEYVRGTPGTMPMPKVLVEGRMWVQMSQRLNIRFMWLLKNTRSTLFPSSVQAQKSMKPQLRKFRIFDMSSSRQRSKRGHPIETRLQAKKDFPIPSRPALPDKPVWPSLEALRYQHVLNTGLPRASKAKPLLVDVRALG